MDGVETEQNIVVLGREGCKSAEVVDGGRAGKGASVAAWRHRQTMGITFSSSMRTAIGYSSSPELGASAMARGGGRVADLSRKRAARSTRMRDGR